MANRPSLALRQWKSLSETDQNTIKYKMMFRYGGAFTSEFQLYAQGTKTPRLGPPGALKGFEYTEKYMHDHGFENAYGELWVHPSGEEVNLLPSNKQPEQEPEKPEQDCTNNCIADSQEDKDECHSCCKEKFPEGSSCQSGCDKGCDNSL
jgi:hypothetical protein